MYVEAAEGGDERGVAVVTEETAISLNMVYIYFEL